MSEQPRFDLVDIVASDYDATIAFFRHLGLEIDEGPPGDIRHADVDFGGVSIHIDNEHLAGLYNSSWRSGAGAAWCSASRSAPGRPSTSATRR